ncbi:MAG: FkbM family methyltransferase [Tepidisphaeraceae bacterium]
MFHKATKDLLKRAGYTLHRMTRFERLLQRELDSGQPFIFVQVGANDGISFDNLYQFNRKNKTSGLVIEPLSDMFERLRYNYRSRPSIKPIRVALHPTASTIVMHRVRPDALYDVPHWASGIASLDPAWHEKCGIKSDVMMEEQVPAMHLMQLLKEHSITRLSLLQVDVEGFDAEVIQMIDFNVIRPAVIKYECVHTDGPDPLLLLLHKHGYQTERDGDDMIAWQH